jgi:Protein of unknown function (DUF2924)
VWLSAQEGGQPMKSKISAGHRATLASGIATLAEATPADLKSRWRALYGTEPPPRISRDLLTRAVAYRIQEETLGGLKLSTRRLLAKVAANASARRPTRLRPLSRREPYCCATGAAPNIK